MTMRLPAPPNGGTMPKRMSTFRPIRVALVEDKRLLREGLGAILGHSAGLSCVGAWASLEQALPALDDTECDVLLLDIGLPGMSGIDGVRVVKERFPGVAVLMLTVYDDEEKVFEALRRGADGYLLKKTPPEKIIEAVRQARDGGAPLSPEVARRMVEHFQSLPATPRAESPLTPQETALLRRLAEGHSYKAAADALAISINTVRDHVRSIYEKLHVHSKSEAVGKALRAKLIE